MHPVDHEIFARCRHEDAHHRAAVARAVAIARPTPVPGLRRQVGARLVAWGERLQAPALPTPTLPNATLSNRHGRAA